MLKKFLVIFFLFLFAMQFVLAVDTEIKIKTPSFTEIHLTVLDPDADYNAYAIYKQTSDAYGDATFTYSGDAFVFDLMVVLKKSDKTISSEKYRENYVAGDPIYLEIIPNGYEIRETPKISGTVTGVDSDINVTNSTEENLTAPVEPEVNSTIQEEAPKIDQYMHQNRPRGDILRQIISIRAKGRKYLEAPREERQFYNKVLNTHGINPQEVDEYAFQSYFSAKDILAHIRKPNPRVEDMLQFIKNVELIYPPEIIENNVRWLRGRKSKAEGMQPQRSKSQREPILLDGTEVVFKPGKRGMKFKPASK